MADDDTRDERLGRLLEVEPLDELARRRLVTTAMRASAPPAQGRLAGLARSRLVAAAAVVAIVVVGGFSYLALRGSDSTAPSASPARPATTAVGSAKSASPQSGGEGLAESNADSAAPTSTATPPRLLGDVGDLQVAAVLDRVRTSTASSAFGATTPQDQSGSASLVARLGALGCAGELPDGTIVAIGTGHYGARDAIVVQTALPDGTTSLDAVVTHPCEVRPLD